MAGTNDGHVEEVVQQQEGEQPVHAGQQEGIEGSPVLTQTIQAGLDMLEYRTEDLYVKIDELTQIGADFIDQLKEAFLVKMQEARSQVKAYVVDQRLVWHQMSEETVSLDERLQSARELVGHLEAGFGGAPPHGQQGLS